MSDWDPVIREPGPEPAATEAPPPTRRSLRPILIAGAMFITAGIWLVIALLPGYLSRGAAPAPEAPVETAAAARRIQANLYFVADDGADLVKVPREVLYGASPAEQAKLIVAAQVGAPPEGFASSIPAGTSVRGVFLGQRGEAYVDLSAEARLGRAGGSLDEALAVYAIVNAVTSNLPDVTAVQILVDGKEVDSLSGHIDLRQPISRSNAWIRKGQ